MQAVPAPIGARFGQVVVIGEGSPKPAKGRVCRRWSLRCDCGDVFEAVIGMVNAGRVTACHACAIARRCKHGGARLGRQHPEYFIWSGLRNRCNSPNTTSYPSYGGRGIRVCARWDSFENFVADMGPRPTPRHTIDRIDNDGNYEPANCRWVTPKDQGRNKRNNRKFTFRGKTLCLTEWAEELGVPVATLRARIRAGYGVDIALGAAVIPGQVLDRRKDRRVCGSLLEVIYSQLLDGETSKSISERLSLQRKPVAEALRTLRSRNLIEMAPGRTWRRCG